MMNSNNRNYYQNLSTFSDFSKAFDADNYQLMPDDWWVVVADIIDSTKAIEAGRYKDINFVGSLPIIATINFLSPLEFPYVFGGDGATLLVPDADKQQVMNLLIATAQTAATLYGLQYRLGAVKVESIRQQGKDVQVAKFNVSNNYQQAFFTGGGLALADSLVKQEAMYRVDLTQDISIEPDFSGLECRWQDIPSYRGYAISLLVQVLGITEKDSMQSYQELLKQMEHIVGGKKERSVVTLEGLTLSLSPKQLSNEEKAFSLSSRSKKPLYKILLENLLGKFLMRFASKNWRFYKQNLIQTTDAEKFDDTLRMVIAVTDTQLKQLTDYFEQEYQNNQLIYGIHVSNSAIMTCLIFERHGKQVHFIDATGGGYAIAAEDFKQRQKIK